MTSSSVPREPSSSLNESTSATADHTLLGTADMKCSVMCAGMLGSGSTWVFNIVVQMLCRAYPSSRIVPTYADDFGPEQEATAHGADWLVFKTHVPSAAMRMLSRLGKFPIILSIRDPRDAVVSLMQRFSFAFDRALDRVVACSNALDHLADLPHVLLRYEDVFTEREGTTAEIAQHLNLQLSAQDRRVVFEKLTPDAVIATIADLQARDAIVGHKPDEAFDPLTHWHPGHIGDRRIGKWKELLTSAQAARVRYATRDFCASFGYNDSDIRFPVGEPVHFSTEGAGVNYLVSGFSHQEAWGIWTTSECASIHLRLEEPAQDSLTIELSCRLAPALRRTLTNSSVRVAVNGATKLRFAADDENPGQLLLCLNVSASEIVQGDSLEIRLEFANLISPAELGEAPDTRLLGLGLSSLKVSRIGIADYGSGANSSS